MSGRGVRVAVVDSGVSFPHPHIPALAGGRGDFADRLGHGTAVAAAILEKAPDAAVYAVRVFDRTLSTSIDKILAALDWCIEHQMHAVNLSLGTTNQSHRAAFEQAVARLAAAGVVLVAARESSGAPCLPGCLPGVISVGLDWECPRDTYRSIESDGQPLFLTSGYPRPIPGVPPERNLHGISFAVANMTGFVALEFEKFKTVLSAASASLR